MQNQSNSAQNSHVIQTIGVIGAGAWGTALALAAVRAGRAVTIWAREKETVEIINTAHRNPDFLPDVILPHSLTAISDFEDFGAQDALLVVSPAQHVRTMLQALKPFLDPAIPVVICSKGIEITSGKLMSDVAAEIIPHNPIAILSGPTFAAEVARGLPCALTLAAQDETLCNRLIAALISPEFRLYGSNDIIGAQVGGAVKNVLAIATGIVSGLKLGENAKAAVITRGLAEIVRFGAAHGAETETLMGLSGLGDLILTCSSTQSRNMSLGKALGEGQVLSDIMAGRKSVAEGVHSVGILCDLAREKGLEMPISFAVEAIIGNKAKPEEMLKTLLSRPVKDTETG